MDKNQIDIPLSSILYIIMEGNNAFVHVQPAHVYQTRMTLAEIEPHVGEYFIKIKSGCLVSVIAIHNITEKVNLVNGESLDYASRHRKELLNRFHSRQIELIKYFNDSVSLTLFL